MGRCGASILPVACPRLGVLGGSFDPPHLGHLVIASEAHARLGLERVLFAPAAAPPHKDRCEQSSPATRMAMTRLAIADDDRFALCDVELELGLAYTRDVLAELAFRHPEHELVFIMGSDSLLQFDSWRDPRGILALCRLAVATRPGDDATAIAAAVARWGGAAIDLIAAPLIGISSTEVRARVAAGLPIRYLVRPAVEELIRARGLYRA